MYGDWYDDHSAAEFAGYGLADLALHYRFASGLAVTLGGENVLDKYPDTAINFGNGRKYPRYSPAGHNGALVYAKVRYSMWRRPASGALTPVDQSYPCVRVRDRLRQVSTAAGEKP